MRWLALAALLAVLATLLWAELVHWRASGRRLGDGQAAGGREAVVVLGFKNRGARPNQVNRFRVRVALRSIDLDAQIGRAHV